MFEALAAQAPTAPMLAAAAPWADWAPAVIAALIVGVSILLMVTVRHRIARRSAARPTPREMIEQLKSTAGRSTAGRPTAAHAPPADAHLVETAQRLAAQLDTKARRLEALLDEAERAMAALSAAIPKADDPSPGDAAEGPRPDPPVTHVPRRAARPGNGSTRPLDPLTRAVYEHADAGLGPVEIARRLDEQVGKVELILALRQP